MKYIISSFMLVCLCSSLFAQPELMRSRDEGVPFFYWETGSIASQDSSLSSLVVNITIPYDELQFLKFSDKRFEAEVELTFIVFDSDEDQIDGKSYRKKVIAENYEQTNSNQIFFSFRTNLDLPPAEYSLLCEVTDIDSKKSGKKKEKVIIRDFSTQNLILSDLLLLNRYDVTKKILKTIEKQFSEILADSTNFLIAAFEIYSRQKNSKFKISYSLIDFRNQGIQEGKFDLPNDGFRTGLNIPILKSKLSVGTYLLKLKIDDGVEKIEIENKFRTHMANLPFDIDNIDVAIDQMSYIADKSDIKRIKEAPEDKKQQYFNNFWKKQDPTPGTAANELMDEYYRRVAFSNAHFSVFREGWKTDMGWIFILFGPPSDVDRQPYNVASNPYSGREIYAYELWNYFEFNRQFIFVDEQGFGEYRLTNPQDVYINR